MAEGLDRAEVRGQAYNFGPEKPLTVLEIVDALRRLMQREDIKPVILNAAKAEIRDQYLCSDKAKRELGWAPQYDLEEGLRETLVWYRQFLSGHPAA